MAIDTTAFKTAQQNMDYDTRMMENLTGDTVAIRFYKWQSCGVTLPLNKPDIIPSINCDKGWRITGGGAVFHSPGDIVFSIAAKIDSPEFPKSFKDKLCVVTKWVEAGLAACEIPLQKEAPEVVKNLAFCTQYPSEYERFNNNQKALAMAVRRFKDRWLVQGVIHTKTHADWHTILPKELHPMLTSGLNKDVSLEALIKPLSYLGFQQLPVSC